MREPVEFVPLETSEELAAAIEAWRRFFMRTIFEMCCVPRHLLDGVEVRSSRLLTAESVVRR